MPTIAPPEPVKLAGQPTWRAVMTMCLFEKVEGAYLHILQLTKHELGRLDHRHLGGEGAEGEGDGLAKVAVGGVAEEAGTGVGVGFY
jgi:hypothetical protein